MTLLYYFTIHPYAGQLHKENVQHMIYSETNKFLSKILPIPFLTISSSQGIASWFPPVFAAQFVSGILPFMYDLSSNLCYTYYPCASPNAILFIHGTQLYHWLLYATIFALLSNTPALDPSHI